MEMPCNFFLLVKTSISCYSIELFLTYIFKAYFCCWFIFLFLSCIETSGSSLWRSCSMSANYFNLFFSQYLQIIFLQLLPYFQMLPSTPFPWKLPFSHPLQASFLSSLPLRTSFTTSEKSYITFPSVKNCTSKTIALKKLPF